MATPPAESATRDWAAPRLAGLSFALGGYWGSYEREKTIDRIQAEGGQVVKEITPSLDYLVMEQVAPKVPSGAEKKVQQLNRSKGASIRVIDLKELYGLFHVNRDQALEMFRAGEKGIARWNQLREYRHRPVIDLRGFDFRGARLAGVHFIDVKLDGADFRDADLTGAHLQRLDGIRFDGACLDRAEVVGASACHFASARLAGATLADVEGCDFPGADLTGARLYTGKFKDCDFTGARLRGLDARKIRVSGLVCRRADLTGADLREGFWQGIDLTRADLTGADLGACKLKKANLRGATLRHAILYRARLDGADLTGADLRGSNLIEAVLDGACVDRARFTGAVQTGLKIRKVDASRATGLDPKKDRPRGTVGPAIGQLEGLRKKTRNLILNAVVRLPEGPIDLQVWTPAGDNILTYLSSRRSTQTSSENVTLRSLGEALFEKTRPWAHGTLLPGSVTVHAKKCPLPAEELLGLAAAAWCEAFGVEVPAPDELTRQRADFQAGRDRERGQLLDLLRGGPEGVARWNGVGREERKQVGSFAGADLAVADLTGVDLAWLDFPQSRFDGARLHQAHLQSGNFTEAHFEKADLRECHGFGARFDRASFRGALLAGAGLWECSLREACLVGADLTGADLTGADLGGADLSGTTLEGAKLRQARFDAQTRFPAGSERLARGMKWAGTGPNPILATPPPAPAGPIDLATFLQRLAANVEPARLRKALQMLRTDRFQLYADPGEQALAGVVKSQTDKSLVYSCRLAAGGSFACCTQNLNVCGGLHGALCKHLLVLIVGLAKKGQLDLARIDQWVADSKLVQPALDKDVMSEPLLRYQAAQHGEIDWRPTETIPEDFYTL
jgi:uncharacterized protein YjbI with pentapeptide repeats